MKSFTTGDVRALCGLPANTIDRWCDAGWVQPTNNCRGTGVHRVFNTMEALALCYAEAWRRAGAGGELVTNTVRYLSGLSEEQLADNVQTGGPFLLMLPDGPQFMPLPARTNPLKSAMAATLDLGKWYAKVTAYRPSPVAKGKKRR